MKYFFWIRFNEFTLFISFFMMTLLTHGQDQFKLNKLDSLHALLTADISDTLRFVALVDVAERFAFVDLDSAVYYFDSAQQMVEVMDDTIWISNLYLVGAKIYDHRSVYDSTKHMIKKSIGLSKAISYNRGIEMGYDLLGGVYNALGEVDSALHYHGLGLQYADSIGKAIGFNNIGLIYASQGKVKEASEYYLKSLEYIDKAYKYADYYLTSFYFNIGVLKATQQEMEEAMQYYDLAMVAAENTGNKSMKAKVFANLGTIMLRLGKIDSSKINLRKALQLHFEEKSMVGQMDVYFSMADVSMFEGNLDSAKYYIDLIDLNKADFKDEGFIMSFLQVRANYYKQIGRYDDALKLVKEWIVLSTESKNVVQMRDGYELRFECLEKMRDFEGALESYKQQVSLQDSFSNIEYKQHLASLEEEYEGEKKDRSIAELSQRAKIQALEIDRKNQGIIIGVVLLLLIAVVIYTLYKQKTLVREKSQTELEQRFLRSQLNPHFISNALVAVQQFMLENRTQKAALYLSKFAKLMREILENSRQEFIPVEDEVNMLTNYLDIHKQRLNNTFDYRIIVDDNIDPEFDTIPPMFVQPFIENAIEHGIADLESEGLIELTLTKQGDYIAILIQDNGKGLANTHGKSNDHTSLSTAIIKERMDLFNKSLKNKIELLLKEVKNELGQVAGMSVELRVPLG